MPRLWATNGSRFPLRLHGSFRPAFPQRRFAGGCPPGLLPPCRRQIPTRRRRFPASLSAPQCAPLPGVSLRCCSIKPMRGRAYPLCATVTTFPLSFFRYFQRRGSGSRQGSCAFGSRRLLLSWCPVTLAAFPVLLPVFVLPAGRPH